METIDAPSFEAAVIPATPARFRPDADPMMIGLSMVNWLILMVLMSGFMLATTMADRNDPAANTSDVGTAVSR